MKVCPKMRWLNAMSPARLIPPGTGRGRWFLAAIVVGYAIGVVQPAAAAMFKTDNFDLYGDFRLRLESDFDSAKTDGTERDDRTRMRVRARVGMNYRPDNYFRFGIRLRSGTDNSQQSPHITIIDFDDNDTGGSQFNFDKYFLEGKSDNTWWWAGRNSFPFWKQNELFWDDDVTPAGAAAGIKFGENSIALNAGYFSLPAGMQQFAGNLGAGQVVFSTKGGAVDFTAAAGVFVFEANATDPDAAVFLQGNGSRDYTIWVGNVQAKLDAGGKPLTLGVDVMSNTKNYSSTDPDPTTAANSNETDGFVVSAKLGKLKEKGDWLLAYYYARIETFAVNNSFAQDDWGRWGAGGQARLSNFKGHELRGAYTIKKNVNVVARFYTIESITTVEDGNRFRLDLNHKF